MFILQAYNPAWAFAANLRERAGRWHRRQLLDADQLAAIETAYPLDFYRPAWALRVGLFLITWLGATMASGTVALMVYSSGLHEDGAFVVGSLVFAAACLGLLEVIIRTNKTYRAGPDNVLLYAGLTALNGSILFLAGQNLPNFDAAIAPLVWAVPLLLTLLVLLAAIVRYADPVVVLAAVVNMLLLLFVGTGGLGIALFPPFVMATAGALLWGHRALRRRLTAAPSLAAYYANSLLTLKVMALALLYLGGNYLVVREGYAFLGSTPNLGPSPQIPLAVVFYVFTAIIPLIYIGLGLRRADRPLLLLGLLTLAFSIFTLRYYRSLLPPEVAAVLAGVFLTALAGLGLRGLRPVRFGLTAEPDDEPRHFDLETLIQAQTAHVPGGPAGGFEFGGGQSGGGGATGQF